MINSDIGSMKQEKNRKLFDEHYEIISLIGRGSRSVVYSARLAANPKSLLALKVLLPQKHKGKLLSNTDRLRKEALAMVSARHRFVIRLDDFHTVDDVSYLAMEYAPERDLTHYTSKQGGRLEAEQGELFFSQAATALDFIHRTGIIHRDIKPSNILVINQHESRLADFGVATLPGEKSDLSDLATGVGTMDYMAPEVLAGTSCDALSDIYSLCLSFYELLTGKHPFQDIPMAKQLEARQNSNLVNIRKTVPAISNGLAKAIMQGLQYRPSDRPAGAGELLQLLSGKKLHPPKANSEINQQGPLSPEVKVEETTETKKKSRSAKRRARKKAAKERENHEQEIKPAKESESDQHTTEAKSPISNEQPMNKNSTERPQEKPKNLETTEPFSQHQNQPHESYQPEPEKDQQISAVNQQPNLVEQQPDSHRERAYYNRQGMTQPTPQPDMNKPSYTQPGRTSNVEFSPPPVARKRKNLLITLVGLLLLIYLFFPNLWQELGSLLGSGSVYDHPSESPLPRYGGEQLVFPNLPAGIYHGSISNLFPNTVLPLAIISWPEQNSVALIVGLEGFSPVIIDFDSEDIAKGSKLRMAANGFVIDLVGRPVGDKITGDWKNMVSQENGTWEVQAVK